MSRSKRVLVIEPSRTIRLLLEISLHNAGHQVIAYPDFTTLKQQMPHFQALPPEVVFVAVNAQRHGWQEPLRQLRSWWSPKKVIMIGLVTCPEHRQQEVRRELTALPLVYLPRPFQVQDALALVFAHHAVPSAVSPGGL